MAQAYFEKDVAKKEPRVKRKQVLLEALERGVQKAKQDKNTTCVRVGVSPGAHAAQAWIDGEQYDEELQELAEEIARAEGLQVRRDHTYSGWTDDEYDYLVFTKR